MENDNTGIMELYKMYVDTTQKVSENRLKVNEFFIGVNTAIIGGVSTIIKFTTTNDNIVINLIFFIFVVSLNMLWIRMIKSHETLNDAKFKVIFELEEKYLPYPFFKKEEGFYKNKNIGRKNFCDIEKYLPILIIVLYVIHLIIIIFKIL